MKRILIVSPHFPPINAPDMQRVRMSLPYYRSFGWEPVVLTVEAADANALSEPELMATIPPEVRVIRCRALSLRWARLIGVGNLGQRALLGLFLAGSRLLRREKFDLVFFSNTQFITFPLGRAWQRSFGVPYVCDFQDPWRTDYYERKGSRPPPGGWKYQFARFQAWLLEGWTLRKASGLISVSASYLEDFARRYPFAARIPSAVIRFGTSRKDLEVAMAASVPRQTPRKPGEVHLLYTGASGPVMPHSLTVLFDALRKFRERRPLEAARLRFHFVGTSYVPVGKGKDSVMPVAAGCGVADQVDEISHRLGHLECLRMQAEADVLLLPGSSDLAYSPSKIYPYYLSGRPILGIVFENSVMERLITELQCAYLVRFSEHGPKEEAHEAIIRFFELALAGFPDGPGPDRNDGYFNQHYLAEELTKQQCDLFDRALEYHANNHKPAKA
jgi:hypothetical protein